MKLLRGLQRSLRGSLHKRMYTAALQQAEVVVPAKSTLTPAQSALAHRIGFQSLPANCISTALDHPSLVAKPQSQREPNEEFQSLLATGTAVLNYFVDEYVRCRFPKLPRDSRQLAQTIYTAPKNLAVIARSIGLEYAIIPFDGLPKVHQPSVTQYLEEIRKENKIKEDKKTASQVMAETLLALLGQLSKHNLAGVRRFIDALIFTAVFDTRRLVKPRYPIIQLAQALQTRGQKASDLGEPIQPVFRLLHETGRTSNSSMYVVGVYPNESADAEILAEGYGPSLILAEHRAALEALRRMYLIDVHDASRPSDSQIPTLDMILKQQK